MPAYRFGDFLLETDGFRLTRGRQPIEVSPRPFDLLAYLVTHPSQLVTREELFQALWPDVIVTDNALTQLVSELRHTLGDSSGSPHYVQTIARRGYRFIAPVAVEHAPDEIDHTDTRDRRSRETSNLDALRAVTEGRLQLEALDHSAVDSALENFDRAITLDPSFAGGYVGRANARFWQYERGRFGYRPDAALLASAIGDARRGITLAPEFAEAHATLAYLLTASMRTDEARAAAQRAIALEPKHWSHHFRLGNAEWGTKRLDALRQCLELYPAFPFAHFQMAMVYVARRDFETASQVLEEGIAVLEGEEAARSRFPANGLYWLVGTIRLSQGDVAGARAAFESELKAGSRMLYASEFSVSALNGMGFACLHADRLEDAEQAFRRSLSAHQEQARAHLGLVIVAQRRHDTTAETEAFSHAADSTAQLRRGGRAIEAALMAAGEKVVAARFEEAVTALDRMLTDMPSGPAGWSIPIDPLFQLRGMTAEATFADVVRELARRAA